MTPSIVISNVRFSAADRDLLDSGLLGWASALVNNRLRLDGIAVRRTADGRLALSFPARRDARGREHAIYAPIDDEARREIERQVFAALGIDVEVGR